MLYLGIDQHARQLTISLRDDAGRVVQARQSLMERDHCRVTGHRVRQDTITLMGSRMSLTF